MFGCFNITPAGIRILGQTCKQLQTLNIGQCYKVSTDCTYQVDIVHDPFVNKEMVCGPANDKGNNMIFYGH